MINNIEEIKSKANIVEIISDHVKLKKDGANLRGLCPFHNERTPSFTVSQSKGIYKCFGCGKSGDSIAFLMEYNNINYIEAIKLIANRYNLPLDEETKSYEKPIPRLEKLQPEAIRYFEGRGISNNTLLRLNVTESVEWMPKGGENTRTICFNYMRDGEVVNIKFRAKDKDFRLHKNSELIFYNIDSIQDETTAVIVEGEIDCLSLHECGIYPVVSVPNGAGTGNLQLKYLDNCWKDFEGKDKIILFTDDDEPGRALHEELARRLGKDRCYKVSYPEGCKDANAVLMKHGKQAIQIMVEEAKRWPIEGIVTMDDIYDQVCDYYVNGYPKGYEAGIGEFDQLLSFSTGQLTVITGSPGSGKSEFIDYISTQLARNHDWKFAVCSFENPTAIHATKLMEKFAGLSFNFRKDPNYRMSRPDFEESVYLTDKYFSFINILQVDITIEGILSKARELVLRTGIKGLIIDPWNYIEHKVPTGYTETQYISEALSLIVEFAKKNDVHVFLVAHPRKLMKDQKTGRYPIANMYDISGSAHFFNKTDNGLSIHRDFDTGIVTVYSQKVRNSWLGKIGFAAFSFDTLTRQYKPV